MKKFRPAAAAFHIARAPLIAAMASLLLATVPLTADIIVTSPPAGRTLVKACAEFSDEVLRDKWDMNERTDLGWWINNTEAQPPSFLTNISFAGGIFSAKTVATPGVQEAPPDYSDMNVSLLDSHFPGSVAIGKNGTVYPINADKYTVLILRMYFSQGVEAQKNGIIYWSKNTVYSGSSWANPFDVFDGWYFYMIDIPALGKWGGTDTWSGMIDSLRIDPIYKKDKDIKIDWIRLVQKDAALEQTITWTGNTGNVDIYLDNNASSADGTLGLLAKNVSGTSHKFLTGGLAAGDYYVVVVPTGTSPQAAAGVMAYSPGYYHVNDVPIVTFTKPSEEGSSEDFASVTFADPWDMANLQDVETTVNLANPQFTTLNYQDLAGGNYLNQTVFKASSTPAAAGNVGDPQVFFLHWVRPDGYPLRGAQRMISADKYHNLTAKMGIAGDWNVNTGSIARIMWKNVDEAVGNVSGDIVIRHLNSNSADYGQWIMNKLVLDLKMPNLLETDPGGSPSTSGWTGWLHAFRIDPLEFLSPREFFFDDIRITANWTANTQFVINWTITDADSSPTISLYYDTDNAGYNGTLIASNLAAPLAAGGRAGGQAAATGSYAWNVTSLPEGKYWLYAVVNDGTNDNKAYAGGPLIVDHDLIPQIVLSRDQLFFNSVKNGPVTSKEKVFLTNAGQGSLNWSVSIPADNPFLKVSPMSGTGNAVLEVTIEPATLPGPGSPFHGAITVTDAKAWNSPQAIDVWGQVYAPGGDAAPFGSFDTPADGSTVSGSVPVTGWVLDDVETTSVMIKRNSVSGDPIGAIGPDGLVFIGYGTFVKGARTDIESFYYQYPRNNRAGWGYMMLTNMLPGQGNGPFTLYAYAYDGSGHGVLLGTKTITCDNNHRVLPFGTLDSPDQGGTISGSAYPSFGWALTPQTKTIPKNGSTILVYVDSVRVGDLTTAPNVYNQYRSDVSTAFPGLNNTGAPGAGGPVGAYFLDTTKYENKIHTISWLVTDDNNAADGIGSRYFEIQNAGTGAPWPSLPEGLFAPIDHGGRLTIGLAKEDDKEIGTDESGRPKIALAKKDDKEAGISESNRMKIALAKEEDKEVGTDEIGRPKRPMLRPAILKKAPENGPIEIEIEELGMMELYFAGQGGKFIGWGATESKELPIGSTLDKDKGIFYWIPGPGFLGRHVLHFAVTDGRMKSRPLEVVVNIVPKAYPRTKK